jgi:outer membrane protease
MKNITVFAGFVIILAGSAPVFGQTAETPRRFSFAVAPLFGMLYGQSEEIVYPFNTRADYLSQLTWDMKPLFYYGAQLDMTYHNPVREWGTFAALAFRAGIPGETGRMEDRDWQSIENSALTNFSSHINQTTGFFWIEGGAGFCFPALSRYQFRASLNASYMYFAFAGQDGYATYARAKQPDGGTYYSISDSPSSYTFSGNVINYRQHWVIVAPALAASARFLTHFSGELSFKISPLIFCTDEDEHLATQTVFRDYTRWGLFLEPGAKLAFSPIERFELALELAYRFITESRGETYQAPMGTENFTASGEGGTGLSLLDAGLKFKIRF